MFNDARKLISRHPLPYWCYALAGLVTIWCAIAQPFRHHATEALLMMAVVVTLLIAGHTIKDHESGTKRYPKPLGDTYKGDYIGH